MGYLSKKVCFAMSKPTDIFHDSVHYFQRFQHVQKWYRFTRFKRIPLFWQIFLISLTQADKKWLCSQGQRGLNCNGHSSDRIMTGILIKAMMYQISPAYFENHFKVPNLFCRSSRQLFLNLSSGLVFSLLFLFFTLVVTLERRCLPQGNSL